MSPQQTDMLHPHRDYMDFLTQGKFMLQRSRESGAFLFHPRVAEPKTGCNDLEWVEASGRGIVYSTTVIRMKPPAVSYNLSLIDLEEGPRMMSRVEGIDPESVTIGMAVKARISQVDGAPLVLFTPI